MQSPINYDIQCANILNTFNGKKKRLLLHACCAPCSSAVLLRLTDFFDIAVYFYNPNIATNAEIKKREAELKRLLELYKRDYNLSVTLYTPEYNHAEFLRAVTGLEHKPEGGERCKICQQLRLAQTARFAQELGVDYFCSTLSISPLKNAPLINELGCALQSEAVQWLPSDFKKRNGFLRSIELSRQYNLYRQDFCGCEFSKNLKPKAVE